LFLRNLSSEWTREKEMFDKKAKGDYMLAVVGYKPQDYRLEKVPVPKAGPEEVIIKVKRVGICASDLKCYQGADRFWKGPPAPYVKPPFIPGHEFIGEVVELGPGAAKKYGLKIGDKAISEQILPCWNCRFCLRGEYWMCETNYVYGFHGGIDDGAMAEYMKFPRGAINYKVPEDLPDEAGVMIEPLACAIHAVQRANIELGDVVVIAGAGAIGLCMLQVAKLKNPGKLIMLDAKEKRLKVAQELGADVVINVAKEDAVAKVKDLSGGYGCDVYIEASGYPQAVKQGLEMIRKLGTYVEFGVFNQETPVDWSVIGDQKELNIRGAHLGPYCYPLAIDYLKRGLVKVDKIVTHVFPLREYKKAMKIASEGQDSIKVTLAPGG